MNIVQEYTDILDFFRKARNKKILVVGDIILDEYIYCFVAGVSSSIKIPVLEKKSSCIALGGAANIAANVACYSDYVSLWGEIGNDSTGTLVQGLLRKKKIRFLGSVTSKETILKKRIYIDSEQIIRIDTVKENSHKSLADQDLIQAVLDSDVVICADYGYGAVTQNILNYALDNSKKIILTSRNMSAFNTIGVPIVVSNENELQCKMGCPAMKIAEKNLQHGENFFITRGSSGISFQNREQSIDCPAFPCNLKNGTGAGDSVCAIIAAFLDKKVSLLLLQLANIAGAIAAENRQTYVVEKFDLLERYFIEMTKQNADFKIINKQIAAILNKKWASVGYKVSTVQEPICQTLTDLVNVCKNKKSEADKLLLQVDSKQRITFLQDAKRFEFIKHLDIFDCICISSDQSFHARKKTDSNYFLNSEVEKKRGKERC